jgi:hypothetical protein
MSFTQDASQAQHDAADRKIGIQMSYILETGAVFDAISG